MLNDHSWSFDGSFYEIITKKRRITEYIFANINENQTITRSNLNQNNKKLVIQVIKNSSKGSVNGVRITCIFSKYDLAFAFMENDEFSSLVMKMRSHIVKVHWKTLVKLTQ